MAALNIQWVVKAGELGSGVGELDVEEEAAEHVGGVELGRGDGIRAQTGSGGGSARGVWCK